MDGSGWSYRGLGWRGRAQYGHKLDVSSHSTRVTKGARGDRGVRAAHAECIHQSAQQGVSRNLVGAIHPTACTSRQPTSQLPAGCVHARFLAGRVTPTYKSTSCWVRVVAFHSQRKHLNQLPFHTDASKNQTKCTRKAQHFKIEKKGGLPG